MAEMSALSPEYWSDHILIGIAIVAACLLMVSVYADRRRHRRKDINAVGFMPWTGITVACVLVTLVAGALAYKSG
jgi:heme A synthase